MNKFEKKIVGIKPKRETDFHDEETGFSVRLRELYPGDEMELKHSIYRLKPGVDFDEIRKAKESGKEIKHSDLMEMDVAKQALETIARKVVCWNLTDEAGTDIDPTVANISKLDPKLFALLEKWAGEIGNPKAEAEAVKN